MQGNTPNQWRVLVVAPYGTDAANTVQVLRQAGFTAEAYRDVSAAADAAAAGCGLLLLTEESLDSEQNDILSQSLARQPTWSNLPVVLIVSSGNARLPRKLGINHRTSITLLERPLRITTLIATVEVALGTRRQQYEIRDLLEERSRLMNSLEERVEERTAKLKAMVSEMESFSYSVSHDLRSPLRVLAGYARVLIEDYSAQLPAEARSYLEKISHAAQRMDRLTQDLLAYTRVASTELALERVDLDTVLDGVIDDYPTLREHKQDITVRRPLGHVKGHGPSLVQCFSNLLENAVKFVRPGEQPRITVSTIRHGGRLRVIVADKGIGIETRHQKRIFELFERAADHSSPGTGIGLAIVKKATERMGGSVGVISNPKRGTEFWIELPAAIPDEPHA